MIISHCLSTLTAIHFFLVLSLSALSVSADLFVSIRCGFSGSYIDENSIVWIGDDNLTQNGEARVVRNDYSTTLGRMPTLRVFTARKKNCYTIKADQGERVRVKASFFYGNYDGKNSPPAFALLINGNHWANVETFATVVGYEIIYVVKRDVISVCVAQTKSNQFPFMSALQVRSLGTDMYSRGVGADYALTLLNRAAFGADEIVRYPDDPYDRIWKPARMGNDLLLKVTTQLAPTITVHTLIDSPPQSVLKNAITTESTSGSIDLTPVIRKNPIPVYLTMYFSELTQLNSSQKRSFEVFKDGESFSVPIVPPPFGNVTEFHASTITAVPYTSFEVVATPDSTLPPLINAMEVFRISGPLTNGTHANDIEGLASLQSKFDVLQGWGGDPCLPAPFSWEWINCTYDNMPRVTALYLGSFGLSGSLPDFSSMTALVTIEMENNSIYGPVPDFLVNLPNLKELNLADNQLTGYIPASLSDSSRIKLIVTGNPSLCTYGRAKKYMLAILGVGANIPAFLIFWVTVSVSVLAILRHRRKTAAMSAINSGQNVGANGMLKGTQRGNAARWKSSVTLRNRC